MIQRVKTLSIPEELPESDEFYTCSVRSTLSSYRKMTSPSPQGDNDEALLKKLGIKAELHRGFSGAMNFAFNFTAVAVVSSVSGLFSSAMVSYEILGWSLIILTLYNNKG